uniref:Uncharacterized protein n=1 Tax=Strongyloides venezuelensis TaxID=75913 RepID=A0A0K0FGR0_STRVS
MPCNWFESSCELKIPYNGNLLKKESLRKFDLFEKDGSHLFMKKVTMDIFTRNSMLEHEYISTDTNTPIFLQITKHLHNHWFLNPENVWDREKFRFTFSGTGEFTSLKQEFYVELAEKNLITI